MPTSTRIDVGRTTLLLLALAFGAAAGTFASHPLATNADLLIGVAGVSATFAGFILAMKTLLGDPSSLLPGSWRLGLVQSRSMEIRYSRLSFLFGLYVVSSFACLTFAAFTEITPRYWQVDFALAFVIAFTATMTLEIPRSLRLIQRERIEATVNARRRSRESTDRP